MMRLFGLLTVCVLLSCSLSVSASADVYATKCATTAAGGNVTYITDGKGNKRCFASITPKSTAPMPVLFWFHGSGGNAGHCGEGRGPEGKSWAQYAEEYKFAFVCGEAVDGLWAIPEIITNQTGAPCAAADTAEVGYLKNMVSALQAQPALYDTTRMFTSGCSMGSGFSIYSAICMYSWYPKAMSSFMSHSTGLKIKGDGLHFPPDSYNPQYSWGECPKCEYFPQRIPDKKLNPPMKACIFDNRQDPSSNNPYFYKSSIQLENAWKEAGNPYKTYYADGGHCQIHSWIDILNCLDDGTGRLIPSGPPTPGHPTPPPSPRPPTPAHPTPPPTPGGTVPAKCVKACETVCPNLAHKGAECETCLKQHMWDKEMTENCEPLPFNTVLKYYCDA